MTGWEPKLFDKTIEVPHLVVEDRLINKAQKMFKPYFLKIPNLRCVQEPPTKATERNNSELNGNPIHTTKVILLNPDKVQRFDDFSHDEQKILTSQLNVCPEKGFGKSILNL